MDGTIIGIGTFTQPATAVAQTISVPSNLDGLWVYNWTQINAAGNAGIFHWMRNSPFPTQGISIAANGAVGLTAANSFVLFNPNLQNFETVSAPVAITNINNGSGVVLTANTTGLSVGSVIRLSNLGSAAAVQLGGVNFRVTAVNPGVSFTIVLPTPTAVIGATTGFYRIIGSPLFVPRIRILSNVSQAVNAVVTTTTAHGFSVGQEVRFSVPQVTNTEYGMTQLDSSITPFAIVLSTPTSTTFTINVDTTGFGVFAFPAGADVPFTFAAVTPFGDDTATAITQVPPLSSLEDATKNTAFLGITLQTGANLPGGVANDVVTWEAYKATFGGL